MSNENEMNQDQSSSDPSGSDLNAALSGGGETEFVTSEEKKPAANGFLYLLLVAAVAGGGMYFMYKRQGPASAQAATSPEAAKAAETINTFLSSGPSGIKQMQDMLKDTEKVVKQFNDYPSVTQVPLSDLQTNPFRFAKAKDDAPDADAEKKKVEAQKTAAVKACEALNLQSIVHSGTRNACMINNTMYTEGQQVEDFTIEKIEAHRVILKCGQWKLQKTMSR